MVEYRFLSPEMRSIKAASIRSGDDQSEDRQNKPESSQRLAVTKSHNPQNLVAEVRAKQNDLDPGYTLQSPGGFAVIELDSGEEVSLEQVTVLGRSPTSTSLYGQPANRIGLPSDPYLSREHIAIAQLNGVAHVIDLSSANGTFVARAGELIKLSPNEPVALQVADIVTLGGEASIKVKRL